MISLIHLNYLSVLIGSLSNDDGNENSKKCLISRFVEDVNARLATTFFFSFWTLTYSFRIQLQKKFANIWRIEQVGISAIKFEVARIYFS